jgi:hypothetical protein
MQRVASFLEGQRIAYRVVGSLASMAYGEPRFTNDVDILADVREGHVTALCRAFPSPEYYLSEPAIRQAIGNPGQFNIIHIPSGIKVDLIVSNGSEYARTELGRGRRLTSPGEFDVWFAAAEDVILNKLRYFKESGAEKHLRDIASMLKVQGTNIDRQYIGAWAPRLGVEAEWRAFAAQ